MRCITGKWVLEAALCSSLNPHSHCLVSQMYRNNTLKGYVARYVYMYVRASIQVSLRWLVLLSCVSVCIPLKALCWTLKWALWACPPLVLAIVVCSVCYWNIRSEHQQAASSLLGDHSQAVKGCAEALSVLTVSSQQCILTKFVKMLNSFGQNVNPTAN